MALFLKSILIVFATFNLISGNKNLKQDLIPIKSLGNLFLANFAIKNNFILFLPACSIYSEWISNESLFGFSSSIFPKKEVLLMFLGIH